MPALAFPSGNKRARNDTANKYQSQAVGLVKDTIQWMIERRMCDYGDESEWRKRSGLEPLPKVSHPEAPATPAEGGGGGGGSRSPIPLSGERKGGLDEASGEVISLLSDDD